MASSITNFGSKPGNMFFFWRYVNGLVPKSRNQSCPLKQKGKVNVFKPYMFAGHQLMLWCINHIFRLSSFWCNKLFRSSPFVVFSILLFNKGTSFCDKNRTDITLSQQVIAVFCGCIFLEITFCFLQPAVKQKMCWLVVRQWYLLMYYNMKAINNCFLFLRCL